jgi:hypothetical protein
MNEITAAIEKAEGFLVLGMAEDAWETLEDLPTEAKNLSRVLEIRMECLCILKEWLKVCFLGEGLVSALPKSAKIRLWFACGLAQTGRIEEARQHAKEAARLDPDLRLRMLDEPALAGLW